MPDSVDQILRKLDKPVVRTMTLARDLPWDDATRTANLAFASDTPCETWFGDLILSMGKKNVRTDRLDAGLALLLDHDRTKQIGIVESFEFGKDGVARAVVKFSRSECGDECFQDVKDGIRRSVSVGFMVHELHLEKQQDAENDLYRSDDWEPIEISLVSIPADISVGVGREFQPTPPVLDTALAGERALSTTENTMTPEEIAAKKAADEAATRAAAPAVETRSAEAILAQRKKDIVAFADVFGEADLARTMTLASDEITLDDVRTAIQAKQKPSTIVPGQTPADQAQREG
jgi:phage head maturation protease